MKMRKVFCILAAMAIAVAAFGCAKKAAEPAASETASAGEEIRVTVVIDGSQANDHGFNVNGKVETLLPAGSSVQDSLDAAAEQLGYEVTKDGVYVTKIGGLGEKSVTANSGWAFDVNGEWVTVPAAECTLNNGDTVNWTFWK